MLLARYSTVYRFMTLPVLSSYSSYGHHRYLPSFPTRRSSDLLGRRRQDRERRLQHLGAGRRGRGGPDHAGPLLAQDRKSTRLNSSHVAISYAVFCLKKKKT